MIDTGHEYEIYRVKQDMQKTPLLQIPLTPSVRFVPQKDNYVNFFDHHTKKNYAMRFKDAASSEAFLVVVALIEAQVLVLSTKSYSGQKPIVLVDQLAIGKGDAVSLTLGDVAGITLKK
ncbi:hypothetical protein PsorP6_001865 [Peronosclerospora sorghi]|uniref:Uncharacterized protein n=1 Tax=Peronosclerospora sorghi TaxID=230839 RepID=A0ACC0WRQ6_9STRA|nr:hypothetical protein PsorP6_001865 [Peronosclerospora sorghi]